jgi:hypothetical protein
VFEKAQYLSIKTINSVTTWLLLTMPEERCIDIPAPKYPSRWNIDCMGNLSYLRGILANLRTEFPSFFGWCQFDQQPPSRRL